MPHIGRENSKCYPRTSTTRGAWLSSADLAARLPSRSLLATPNGWAGLHVQMYRHPPGAVDTPGNLDHLLVLHVGGDARIEDVTAGHRRRAWAGPGCFSLTPAGQSVVRSWEGNPEVLLVYLKTTLLDDVAHDLQLNSGAVELLSPLAQRDPILHHFGALLRAEVLEDRQGSALKVEYLARALAVHVLQSHSSVSNTKRPVQPPMNVQRLRNVVDYMQCNLDKAVSLADLAAVSGLSETHFSRAFRRETGSPPHSFLVDLRLHRACELLEHTDQTITDISITCGFERPQYFATAFRRKFGQSPSSWRSARALTIKK
jgi:AraC family transcriptional regulator